jgi:hypothetical protein
LVPVVEEISEHEPTPIAAPTLAFPKVAIAGKQPIGHEDQAEEEEEGDKIFTRDCSREEYEAALKLFGFDNISIVGILDAE